MKVKRIRTLNLESEQDQVVGFKEQNEDKENFNLESKQDSVVGFKE